MGKTQSSDMKTAFLLLLLSVVGLGLVCAELHGEDQYTEDANVVAVDDSAAAMDESADDEMEDFDDEMDDSRRNQDRRRKWHSFKNKLKANFHFPGQLETEVIVSQTKRQQLQTLAKWSAQFSEFNNDICPSGTFNWHVHEYPVSETASNFRTMNTQIKSFNTQNGVTGTVTASTSNDGKHLTLDWDLEGLPAFSLPIPTASTSSSTGSNGIHVHYGTSCDSEATVKGDAPDGANAGHYYNPAKASVDPWANVKYTTDPFGKSTGSVKISAEDLGVVHNDLNRLGLVNNRVVIVHNRDGNKIGCGVLSFSAPGCGADVAGGHYDPTFACGGASQNNANGVCSNLRATDEALRACSAGNGLCVRAGNGVVKAVDSYDACTQDNQAQYEIGDQSGKMGKLHALRTRSVLGVSYTSHIQKRQKFTDRWMEKISNLEGRSLVLHCCTGTVDAYECSERLACANLE